MPIINRHNKHWSDFVHSSTINRNASGHLNLIIKGGAEDNCFPYFGEIKQKQVLYESGKIHDEEILLEINNQSVVGLTLYDLNSFIKSCQNSVHFKTVPEGHGLVNDLKVYLSRKFSKGSVDHQLQTAIRDNLYLRSLPCTTRKLREGEVDGVDYTFLSVEEFKELENSGSLLESGIFEGNHYGTPKPLAFPLTPAPLRRVNSFSKLPGRKPSSHGKRKRNRSNIELRSSSNSSYDSKREARIRNGPFDAVKKEPETKQTTNGYVPKPIQEKQRKAVNSQTKSAPLPKGWEMAFTTSGERYFIKERLVVLAEEKLFCYHDSMASPRNASHDNST